MANRLVRKTSHDHFGRHYILLVLLAFLSLMTPRPAWALFDFQAVNGNLDLSWWSPVSDGPVALSGVWHMRPGLPHDGHMIFHDATGWRYATLPGPLDIAASDPGDSTDIVPLATYHLRLRLPRRGYQDLALLIPAQPVSFSLFVNDQLVAGSGDPLLALSGQQTENRDAYPLFVPVSGGAKTLDIHLVAAQHGDIPAALSQPILLGDAWHMQVRHIQHIAWHAVLIGFLVLFAVFFLAYFALRPKLQQFLFLGMFCLIGAVFAAAEGHMLYYLWPNIQYSTVWVIKTILLILLVPVFYGFYWRYFPSEFQILFMGLTLGWAVVSLLWMTLVSTGSILAASQYAFLPLFLMALICLNGLMRAWRNGRKAALRSVPAVVAMAAMALVDVLSIQAGYQNIGLTGEGFALVVILASLVGAGDYERLYRQVLAHNKTLEHARDQLRQTVEAGKGPLEEREQRLGSLIARDRLTGLISRDGLLARLAVECRRAQSFDRGLALVMIDIRETSDGGETGTGVDDQAIRLAAEEIWSFLADTDYLAHLGNARFAAILIEGDQDRLDDVGQALPDRLQSLLPADKNYVIQIAGSDKASQADSNTSKTRRLDPGQWFDSLEHRFTTGPGDSAAA